MPLHYNAFKYIAMHYNSQWIARTILLITGWVWPFLQFRFEIFTAAGWIKHIRWNTAVHWFGQFSPVVSRRKTRFLSEISSYYTKLANISSYYTKVCDAKEDPHNESLIDKLHKRNVFVQFSFTKGFNQERILIIDLHVLQHDGQNSTFVLANGRASEENSPPFLFSQKTFHVKVWF